MGEQGWDSEAYDAEGVTIAREQPNPERPGWARIRDKLEADLMKDLHTPTSLIEATPDEVEQAQGMVARENEINAESVTWCMHCGRNLVQIRSFGVLKLTHPLWLDSYNEPHLAQSLTIVLSEYKNAQDMVLALGKWIREEVHPEAATTVPGKRIPSVHEPVAVYDLPQPEYTEAKPDPHLLESIKPLMGPHLAAITQVMHLTEVIGPMQQWSATGEEDCGFQVEITIRVVKTGGCFDNVRERRHMGTAMCVPVQGHENHGHPGDHEVPDGNQESTGQHKDSSLGSSEGDG